MITTASEQHVRGIKELWQEAFGGDDAYAEMFLSRGVHPDNTLVYLQDDGVCGMLFILPCSLVFGELSYKCAYLYAIATGEQYRGRGISTGLLDAAHDLCTLRGYDVCALVPASHSLFDFYGKRGYGTQGYVRLLSIGCEQLADSGHIPAFSPIGMGEIIAMRAGFFGGGYLAWDKWAMRYIVTENEYLGGCFYRYTLEGDTGFLSCLPSGNSLLIREYTGKVSLLPQIAGGLHRIYNKENYIFRLSNTAEAGVLTPFAMTRWISQTVGAQFYLSHVLE